MARKVILDVDTGTDDALGILLALNSPELELVGITTVSGNLEVEGVTRNTLQVLELTNSENIPVAKGMSNPLSPDKKEREIIIVKGKKVKGGEYFHGKDGLGNSKLPSPKTSPVDGHAVDFLIDNVRSNPHEVTLITTAPLTNLAKAIMKDPEIVELVDEHIMMGGAYGLTPYGYGNVTPVSEFNAWADPIAANKVFSSKLSTIAIGLDVTQDPAVALTEDCLDYFTQETELHAFISSLISFFLKRGREATYPHDPIAISAAIDRGIFEIEDFLVKIETKGTVARGQTVVEKRPEAFVTMRGEVKTPNARICRGIDGEKFMNLFLNRLSKMG